MYKALFCLVFLIALSGCIVPVGDDGGYYHGGGGYYGGGGSFHGGGDRDGGGHGGYHGGDFHH